MKSDKEIFTEWLRDVVKVKGRIKGKDLAKKAKIHPSTLSGYFSGKTKGPDLEIQLRICEALNEDREKILQAARQQSEQNSLLERVNRLEATIPANEKNEIQSQRRKKRNRHYDIVDEFPEEIAEDAEIINEYLLKISKIDLELFSKIKRDLEFEIKRLEKKKDNENKENGQGKSKMA